jgi:hypothetical protein
MTKDRREDRRLRMRGEENDNREKEKQRKRRWREKTKKRNMIEGEREKIDEIREKEDKR